MSNQSLSSVKVAQCTWHIIRFTEALHTASHVHLLEERASTVSLKDTQNIKFQDILNCQIINCKNSFFIDWCWEKISTLLSATLYQDEHTVNIYYQIYGNQVFPSVVPSSFPLELGFIVLSLLFHRLTKFDILLSMTKEITCPLRKMPFRGLVYFSLHCAYK